MADQPENPPAFPTHPNADRVLQKGMTLRDWFAGQALAGMLAQPTLKGSDEQVIAEEYARSAYLCAAAMLTARAKRNG